MYKGSHSNSTNSELRLVVTKTLLYFINAGSDTLEKPMSPVLLLFFTLIIIVILPKHPAPTLTQNRGDKMHWWVPNKLTSSRYDAACGFFTTAVLICSHIRKAMSFHAASFLIQKDTMCRLLVWNVLVGSWCVIQYISWHKYSFSNHKNPSFIS